MKKTFILFALLIGLAVSGCLQIPANNQTRVNTNTPVEDDNEFNVFDFKTCVQAGNPIMKSNPPQCRHNGVTYVQELPAPGETKCLPEQRDVDVCIEIYQPVCAKVNNVQCFRAPCPPMAQTFSNACQACRNSLVESYTAGACPGENNAD